MQPLNDNPRLGFESKNPALHPGHNVCQSTVALRLSWSVASKARQSEVMDEWAGQTSGRDRRDVTLQSFELEIVKVTFRPSPGFKDHDRSVALP